MLLTNLLQQAHMFLELNPSGQAMSVEETMSLVLPQLSTSLEETLNMSPEEIPNMFQEETPNMFQVDLELTKLEQILLKK